MCDVSNYTLKELQAAELSILKYLDAFCKSKYLKYYMCNGTLLGAVRHGGFIPWDDDVDICMPRPDFEKLILLADDMKASGYVLSTYSLTNDTQFPFFHLKVEDPRIKIKRTVNNLQIVSNSWVDIWPLDGVPNGRIQFALYRARVTINRIIFTIANCSKPGKRFDIPNRKGLRGIVAIFLEKTHIGRKWDLDACIKRYCATVSSNDYYTANQVVNCYGNYVFNEMYQKSVFGEGQIYSFEGQSFVGPCDADKYLSSIYGDYMQLPPKEKQVNKHIYEIIK